MSGRPTAVTRAAWLAVLTAGVSLAVALVEVKLGSLYHMALALGLAGLVMYSAREPDRRQGAVTLALLAYGIVRLVQDLRVIAG